jgi:hypothetical protein
MDEFPLDGTFGDGPVDFLLLPGAEYDGTFGAPFPDFPLLEAPADAEAYQDGVAGGEAVAGAGVAEEGSAPSVAELRSAFTTALSAYYASLGRAEPPGVKLTWWHHGGMELLWELWYSVQVSRCHVPSRGHVKRLPHPTPRSATAATTR